MPQAARPPEQERRLASFNAELARANTIVRRVPLADPSDSFQKTRGEPANSDLRCPCASSRLPRLAYINDRAVTTLAFDGTLLSLIRVLRFGTYDCARQCSACNHGDNRWNLYAQVTS